MLDNHKPRKKKYICGNHKPFINKRLPKAITQQTRFRKQLLKNLTDGKMYIYIKTNKIIYVCHF